MNQLDRIKLHALQLEEHMETKSDANVAADAFEVVADAAEEAGEHEEADIYRKRAENIRKSDGRHYGAMGRLAHHERLQVERGEVSWFSRKHPMRAIAKTKQRDEVPVRRRRTRRDSEPGYDVVRYASGKAFVAPAAGRPDYHSKREAYKAMEQMNAEWARKGRPTLSQEMSSFFAPVSRDASPKRFRSKREQQAFISRKIRILRREGYPPKQAVAIALRYAGVSINPRSAMRRSKSRRKNTRK